MELRTGLKEIRYGLWKGQTSAFVQEPYPDDYVRWLTEPAWNPPTEGKTAVQMPIEPWLPSQKLNKLS
jgi:broad specificity phosphatase PhoE